MTQETLPLNPNGESSCGRSGGKSTVFATSEMRRPRRPTLPLMERAEEDTPISGVSPLRKATVSAISLGAGPPGSAFSVPDPVP